MIRMQRAISISLISLFAAATLSYGVLLLDNWTHWPTQVGEAVPLFRASISFVKGSGQWISDTTQSGWGLLAGGNEQKAFEKEWAKRQAKFYSDHPYMFSTLEDLQDRCQLLAQATKEAKEDLTGFMFPTPADEAKKRKALAQAGRLNLALANKQRQQNQLTADINQLNRQMDTVQKQINPLRKYIPSGFNFFGTPGTSDRSSIGNNYIPIPGSNGKSSIGLNGLPGLPSSSGRSGSDGYSMMGVPNSAQNNNTNSIINNYTYQNPSAKLGQCVCP